MSSGNPMLREGRFAGQLATGEVMTVGGTVNKTLVLLTLAVVTGGWTWLRFNHAMDEFGPRYAAGAVSPFMWGGLLAGLALALVTSFAPRWSAVTAPLYAIAEGFALGALSAMFEQRFPGIVTQAVMLTMGVLAAMLLLYRSGIIKVTDRFRTGVVAATVGVMLVYLADILLRSFAHTNVPFIHETGTLGILVSLVVVGIAAANLALDFDLVERGAAQGAAKYMEWYGAFALMVTLVWLYLELLRLLSKIRR